MKRILLTFSFLLTFLASHNANAQCKATMDYLIYDSTNTIIFNNTGSSGSGYGYAWDFGDGSSMEFTERVVHKYAKNGTYKVTFYVHNTSKKCIDTLYTYVVASGKNPCNAEFTSVQDKSNHWKYTFSAVDTAEENYEWWSPAYSTKKTLTHTYTSGGAYKVILYVTNSKDHCIDTVIKTINVNNCRANFIYTILNSNLMKYYFFSPEAATKYKWYINGKLLSSKSDTASYLFTSLGYQSACLVIYDSINNCSDSLCKNLNVKKCSAYFGAFVNQGTKTASFTDASSNNITHYYWNFGDGTTLGWGTSSAYKNPTHKYNKAGKYWVTLMTVDSITKCGDSSGMSITVNSCDADFTINQVSKSSGIYRLKSPYKASSSIKHAWYIGTKTSWTGDSLILNFGSSSGSVTVCHKLIDTINNCSDSVCKKVVYGKTACDSSFTYKVSNDSVYFAYTGGATKALNWDFGTGYTIDTSKHITQGSYQFSTYGTYQFCLKAYCSSSSFSVNCVQVTINQKCDANYTYNPDATNKFRIDFYPKYFGSQQHKWYFGDGNTSAGPNPSHTYSVSKSYSVCHVIYDSIYKKGCKDSVCQTVTVNGSDCDSSFSYRVSNDSIYFGYSGTGTKTKWNFGDGTIDSGFAYGSYVYAKPGTYNVCLTTYCTSTKRTSKYCVSVTIKSKGCTADFTTKADSANKYKIYFNNLSSTSSTMKYYWDFGDGKNSSSVNPTNTYSATGNYTVCLYISDSATKCTDTICKRVTAAYPICDSVFNHTVKGDSLYFVYNNNAKTVKYNFGDGKTSNSKTGYHVYSKPGNYKVCLTAYCSSTDSSEYCTNITIKPKCEALFTIALDTTQKFKLFLINKSSNTSSTHYTWDFGDGSYSGSRNPTHKYSKFGKFRVCLTILDTITSCYDTMCKTLGLDSNGKLLKAGGWELVVIDQSVFGINKIVKSDFKIYPNPANTKVTIDLSNTTNSYQKLEVLNANGQVCIVHPIEKGSETMEVDLERISCGLYLIKLSNDDGYSYMKLMKN